MSYEKPHLAVSDFAVGVQSVNRATDNNQALFDQFDANHSTGLRGGGPSDAFLQLGQHDDPLISRTVAQYIVDTALSTPALVAVTGGSMLHPTPPERLGTGQWRIYVSSPRFVSAKATPRSSAAVDRACSVRVVNDASGPHLIVTTWNIGAGAPADFDFDLAFWSEGLI